MLGYQFMRQKPIGHYVVDFYCSRLGLAIEIDGDSHRQKYERDIKRQSDLEGLGVCFLRFHDHDVKRDISNVLRVIQNWIEQREKSCPDSRRKEGRR
jgi:very-short-patch-repair endonuclease